MNRHIRTHSRWGGKIPPVVTWRRKLLVRFSFLVLREAQFSPQRDFTLLLYHTQAVFKNFCLKIYAKLFAFLY